MTTSFREVADRRARGGDSPVLPRSGPNSPMSWYIPSDPPSRATSKLSSLSRQSSAEEEGRGRREAVEAGTSPMPAAARGDETYRRPAASTRHSRHFGHQYPSRQVGT